MRRVACFACGEPMAWVRAGAVMVAWCAGCECSEEPLPAGYVPPSARECFFFPGGLGAAVPFVDHSAVYAPTPLWFSWTCSAGRAGRRRDITMRGLR